MAPNIWGMLVFVAVVDVCKTTLALKYGKMRIVEIVLATIPKKNDSVAVKLLFLRLATSDALTRSNTVYCKAGLKHNTTYAWIPLYMPARP
jgi:hypothetical protein